MSVGRFTRNVYCVIIIKTNIDKAPLGSLPSYLLGELLFRVLQCLKSLLNLIIYLFNDLRRRYEHRTSKLEIAGSSPISQSGYV